MPTEYEEKPILSWLKAHRTAWAGWPTFRDEHDRHADRRDRARLRRIGLPGADEIPLPLVDLCVAKARAQLRRIYVKQAEDPEAKV